ncbi:MAG: hypothetical protein WCH39_24935, partial [Schlesneria sp.]
GKKSEKLRETVPALPLVLDSQAAGAEVPVVLPVATVTAADESGRSTSSWNQLRDIAFGVLMGVVQDVASRSVPRIVDYLTGESAGAALREPPSMDEQSETTNTSEALDTGHHFRIASSGIARTGNSF